MTMEADLQCVAPFLEHGVGQVALIVQDLDRAVECYWKTLRIGPWIFYTYGKPLVKRMTFRGAQVEYKFRVALSKIGDTDIELIELVEGPTIYEEFVEKHGYGLHHLGLVVEHAAQALAEARAMGLEVIQSGEGYGVDGDGGYYYLDTEEELGMILELVELPRRRVAPEKVFPAPDTR